MPGFFEKFIFELETFPYSIKMGLSQEKQSMSLQKMFVLSPKFTILNSWSPVCTMTFNLLLLSWVTTLVATTNRSMVSGQSCKTTYMTMVKASETRPFIFIFRLNIVLHDSYQADEIVMEIEEWKRRVSEVYVKSLSRV